jgi:ribosome biogenesis protein
MASTSDAASNAMGNVVVNFFTTTSPHHMPEQTFSIPVTTLPEGLQRLVDSVLEVPSTPYDFLINDEFIGTSLERFLRKRRINMEEVVAIEYTPAMQAQEGSKMPHDDWVSSVRAPQAGNPALLLTAAYDHCVRLWNNEECIAIGSKHTEAVKEVALHPRAPPTASAGAAAGKKGKTSRDCTVDAFYFVSGGKDGKMIAWEFRDGEMKPLGVAQAHVGSVDTVDISSDGSLVASGSWDAAVKVFQWDHLVDASEEKKTPLLSLTDHVRPVLGCRFSPSSRNILYSTGLDGNVKVWDTTDAQLVSTLSGDHAIHSLAAKPTGSAGDLLLVGATDNRIRLYDCRQKDVVKTFSGHRQWVYSVAWLWRADEQQGAANVFASASEDATVRIWDLRCTSSALVTLDALHTDGVLDVCYVGGSEIASGGKDNKTKTFSLKQGSA